MQLGQREDVGPGQQARRSVRRCPRLGSIIGLGVQLALGLGQQRGEVHPARQKARQAQQRGHVVDVAVDAGAHAGILHLDRQVAAIAQRRPGAPARSRPPQRGARRSGRSGRYQPGPHSAFSTVCSCFGGMWRASSRIRPRMAVNSSGSTSPVSIDSICPSFSAAPRRCDSPSVRRSVLAGVSRSCARSGRLPWPARASHPPRHCPQCPWLCRQTAKAAPRARWAPQHHHHLGARCLSCQCGTRVVRLRNRRRCQR